MEFIGPLCLRMHANALICNDQSLAVCVIVADQVSLGPVECHSWNACDGWQKGNPRSVPHGIRRTAGKYLPQKLLDHELRRGHGQMTTIETGERVKSTTDHGKAAPLVS